MIFINIVVEDEDSIKTYLDPIRLTTNQINLVQSYPSYYKPRNRTGG